MKRNLLAVYERQFKNSPNFMTPDILAVKQWGDQVIELSSGTGIENEPIYGVSVWKFNWLRRTLVRTEQSRMVKSLYMAKEYFKTFGDAE